MYFFALTEAQTPALEIRASMLFNLVFANKNSLSCFFFFFLIIDLCFLIPVTIAQAFNPIAEFVIPIGIPSEKTKGKNKYI